MKSNFKEMGNYLIQMGLYLCTVEAKEFEERSNIKDNIINFLMQSYLYLKTYNEGKFESQEEVKTPPLINEEAYLSRKEVLEQYYPLFTEYGLTQSIHTKDFPYIKRGSKYFFKKSEIDVWLKTNKGNCGNTTIKFV